MDLHLLLEAALLSPPYTTLTYALPPWLPLSAWCPGMRVAVPLGKSCRAAVVLGIEPAREDRPQGLKFALWPLEHQPLLDAGYLELARNTGLRHCLPPGRILGTVLPAPLRLIKGKLRFFGDALPRELALQEVAALAGRLEVPQNITAEKHSEMPLVWPAAKELERLGAAWAAGRGDWSAAGDSPLDTDIVSLAQDPPWPVRPRATRQMQMLEYLLAKGSLSKRRLFEALGPSSSTTLTLLTARKLLRVERAAVSLPPPPEKSLGQPRWNAKFSLNPAQTAIVEALSRDLHHENAPSPGQALRQARGAAPRAGIHLLHGITGSGKTALYMALAARCLAGGKNVLLLAPEVALALKLQQDAAAQLAGVDTVLYHGYLGLREREAIFRDAATRNRPVLVIGTRSALFLPLQNIGLIILDEEHDSSFKQDEGLTYQAKELAWYKAGQHEALLLLGSATPDVKSYYAARQGRITLHELPRRVGEVSLPELRFVRPGALGPSGADVSGSILARESLEALGECARQGNQAIILLNRRGYAPFMYCLNCRETLRCPHCDISLTYHKGREKMLCHYCGFSLSFPCPCPSCGSLHYLPMGEGTEKLEETLLPHLPPNSGILRLDRDSTRRPGRMEEILASFARGDAAVLVGTQMLSKGHHFPNVTLVVAADADLGLNLPDYRAAEKSFQLILQAAGRSGRGEKPGQVIIQTRDPDHYCWEYVRANDYVGFFEHEIALREKRLYPPFVRLGLIRLSFPADWTGGMARLEAITAALREHGRRITATVLGPAPAPLAMLRGYKRFHCLIKSASWLHIRELYLTAARAAGHSRMRIALDPDPVNML